jgi:hypothetical protein
MSLSAASGLPGFGIPGLGALPGPALDGLGSSARRPLTEGIPDPAAVQRQKETYARSLEDQLRKGVEVLAATHKQQTDLLHAQANQEKHRYNIALDQQVKQRELELSQQYNEQLMRLQQAAQVQRADLEQQACGLTLEYQQRKVQEEYLAQQQGIQNQHAQAQTNLNVEIQKLTAGGISGLSPATLMERVQANVQVGKSQPMASYSLPQQGMVQPSPLVPGAPGGIRPYVPPGFAPGVKPPMLAAPKPGGPLLSYMPSAGVNVNRGNLSYVPANGAVATGTMAAPSTMITSAANSFTTATTKRSTSYVPPVGMAPGTMV